METVPQRLLALAQQRDVSLSQLSRLIGRNATYLQQFVRKGSPRRLEETDRRTLARFLAVDETELGASSDAAGGLPSARRDTRAGWVDVPRLALGASAGSGTVPAVEEAIGAFRFSARWLRDQDFDPSALTAICVEGDSMEPTLRDGDEILVDGTPRPLRDGIHVVRVDEVLLVKRLAGGGGRGAQVTLLSDNRAYPPVVREREQVEVIGRVVWKSGRI